MSEPRRTLPATPPSWPWPVDLSSYDRRPDLSPEERLAVASIATPAPAHGVKWPTSAKVALERLIAPICDVTRHISTHPGTHHAVVRALLSEMHARGSSYWGWSSEEWLDVIGPRSAPSGQRAFEGPSPRCAQGLRGMVSALAYLLGPDTFLSLTTPRDIRRTPLARKVFTPAVVERERRAIADVLAGQTGWGYVDSECTARAIRWAVAELLLRTRGPHLGAVTFATLTEALAFAEREQERQALRLVARVLAHHGSIPQALPPAGTRHDDGVQAAGDGVAPTWRRWVVAWQERSARSCRANDVVRLLAVGRWLAETHPHIVAPDQWDEDLVATFVAAVRSWTAGQYAADRAILASLARRGLLGKPLMPRTINGFLGTMRAFFSALQETPHMVDEDGRARVIPRRFNAARAFATPRAIKALIGPDPRVIDDATWFKLVHAAGQLTEDNLPCYRWTRYPLAYVKALAAVWCYSARRSDEIARLRTGCIRWAWDEAMRSEAGEVLPEDAYCFLHVPTNKTSTAFWVPVNGVVGRAVEAWEKERPSAQPAVVDAKDHALVDLLFCHRGTPLRKDYINRTLIPILCTRAGVPAHDSRGRITSHRARATIATALYNAEEGLTLDELRELLGHRALSSTMSYARVNPLRLAKRVKVASASMRRVPALYDPAAEARGEPHIFFQLDEQSYCGNPAWHACPHRLACQRCPMFVGPGIAKEIAAREGIIRMLADVPMTPEEKAAAEGDLASLTEMIALKKNRPTPVVPSSKYVFNPSARAVGTPLPLVGEVTAPTASAGSATKRVAALGVQLAERTRQIQELERTRGNRAAAVRALRRECAHIVEDMMELHQPSDAGDETVR